MRYLGIDAVTLKHFTLLLQVKFHQCPMPPRFDRPQAVMIQMVELTSEVHHKWTDKETPEEFLEDQEAIREEAKMNASLIQQMSPQRARQLSVSR